MNRDVHYVLFSPDDRWLAVAEVNHSIGIFNAKDGTPVLEFSALRPDHGPDGRAAVCPPRAGGMIAFSPDGNLMGSVAGMDVSITDLRTGELVTPEFRSGGGDLHDLDWSPDGRRVLVAGGGYPAEVRIHDAKTGELLLLPLLSGERQGLLARWSADGRFIVSRNDDKTARVWDAATAEPITPMLRHQDNVRWCWITPHNQLITASGTNLIRAWDLKPTALAQDVIADYAKLFAGRRLSASGALLELKPVEMETLLRSLRARAPQLFE